MDEGNLLSHLGVTVTYISVAQILSTTVGPGVRKPGISCCLYLLLATHK